MNTRIICTFIGDDQPGLVKTLAEAVTRCEGNWLESSMAKLAGHFAGIVAIEIDQHRQTELASELEKLASRGLKVSIANESAEQSSSNAGDDAVDCSSGQYTADYYQLSIIGNDRPGIVHEITEALSINAINVLEMSTRLSSAAMSGDALFHSNMSLAVPESVDMDTLESQLDTIAAALSIEIDLEASGNFAT